MSQKKLFVFCLDGARLDSIKKWVDEGYLPTFKKLIEQGSSGIMKSILPGPHTALIFSSLITGTKPDKHEFLYTFMPFGKNEFKLFQSNNLKGERIWNILSENNVSVGLMDLCMTYPPSKVNGFMVCAGMTPAFAKEYTYPPELRQIMDNYGGCSVVHCESREPSELKRIYDYTDTRLKALQEIMVDYDVNVIFHHIIGTEIFNDLFASFRYPNNSQFDPSFEGIVRDYYISLDNHFKDLIGKYKDSNFLLFSDHGSHAVEHNIYLNNLLKELSIFESNKVSSNIFSPLKSIFHVGAGIYYKLPFSVQKLMRQLTPEKIGGKFYKPVTIDANWENTIAYAFSWGMIFINKSHKNYNLENHNLIVNEVYQKLVSSDLMKKHARKIYKKEELFGESCPDFFPDLCVDLNEDCVPLYSTDKDKLIEPCTHVYHNRHAMDGMFIVHGPDIKKNKSFNFSILDITPTILHMCGLKVPLIMDGKVMKEIFDDDSEIAQREIDFDPAPLERKKINNLLDEINF